MTEMKCGSPDLDAGMFYVRLEIDGRAVLSACSICAECQAMVLVGAIDSHADWHTHINQQIRGW